MQQSRSSHSWHHGPSWLWLLSFVVVIAGDVLVLQRWTLLPVYVMCFYGGMVVIDLLTYPLLERWRAWLRMHGARGKWVWYLVEVGGMWLGSSAVLIATAPLWLAWRWQVPVVLQVVGWGVLAVSVGVGVWAAGQMGWARLLFASALFPPGESAQQNDVPQRLVLSGPYRYVRNPLYVTDATLIASTALVTQSLALVGLLVIYLAQLAMQVRLEERELRQRFGAAYERYLRAVPRFVPRLRPVDPAEIEEPPVRQG
ncbi:MAG: methyltransferase family protein [Thermoflexales bacterium]